MAVTTGRPREQSTVATPPERLHDEDFYAWTREQAEALRRLADGEAEVAIDWDNLVEEVEGLGDEALESVWSQLERLIPHLLKLEHSPSPRPRRQWLLSVNQARRVIRRRWSPTIERKITPELTRIYRAGLKDARLELADQGEIEAARALPAELPYRLDQLLEEDWYPTNRHGLVDKEL